MLEFGLASFGSGLILVVHEPPIRIDLPVSLTLSKGIKSCVTAACYPTLVMF
jgi:hypothetical protein